MAPFSGGTASRLGSGALGAPQIGAHFGDERGRKEECLRNGLERRQFRALGIFSRPPKRLWTRNLAGALYTEAVRCTFPVGRELRTEISAV
jgi:hypothetical protein